jgi:hypothetical protein
MVVVVHGPSDFRGAHIAAHELITDLVMAALNFVVNSLTKIVEEASRFADLNVGTKLGGEHARQV